MKSKKRVRNTNKSKKNRKIKGGDYDQEDYDYLDEYLKYNSKKINNDQTILHFSIFWGDLRIAFLILNHLHMYNMYKITRLLEKYYIYKIDVNARDNDKDTALNIASRHGYMKIVELLLKKGAKVNNHGFSGETPLHNLFKDKIEGKLKGTSSPIVQNDNYFYNSTKLLIKNGADVNALDVDKNTPLHTHCDQKHKGIKSIVKALLKNGANVNAKNKHGDTPLHLVCKNNYSLSDSDDYTIAELLINNGSDMTAINKHGYQPLYYISNEKVKKWMSEKMKHQMNENMKKHLKGLMTLNEKKVDGKLLPHDVLRLFREYEGTVNHKEIMTKRDDDLQLEGSKYFGGKFNTNNSFLV